MWKQREIVLVLVLDNLASSRSMSTGRRFRHFVTPGRKPVE